MNLVKYRIAAGHYKLGEFTVRKCGGVWELKDDSGDFGVFPYYNTARSALLDAERLMKTAVTVRTNKLRIELV
jgi:hypothetical protein